MSMNFREFLGRVIDEGKEAATQSFSGKPEKNHMLQGSLAGFEICRDKSPPQLAELLQRGQRLRMNLRFAGASSNLTRYWKWACYVNEIEWVCNVVSAALYNQGMPVIVTPTARGVMKAASILGTKVDGLSN